MNLSPLRERREDVPVLAREFLAKLPPRPDGAAPLELTNEIIAALTSYDWPGNVRALRNVIDQAGIVVVGFLELPYKEARRQALEAFELAYAQHVVDLGVEEKDTLPPDDED